jgi:REP element-mobilizing transposase RayT
VGAQANEESGLRYDSDRHHRRSIRLRGYDYSREGLYFMTIVTRGRALLLGKAVDGRVHPSDAGREVQAMWECLPDRFPRVRLVAFVLMPNHVHFVLAIVSEPLAVQGEETSPLQPELGPVGAGFSRPENLPAGAEPVGAGSSRPTLGQVVAYFKHESTKFINALPGMPGEPVWQRNYYEHIIRDEDEFLQIRRYITENPSRWDTDKENPDVLAP